MANKPRPLDNGFEREYANLLIGTDTLCGGDIGKPEGAAHFIADSYPKAEVELPAAYYDKRAAEIRAKGGVDKDNAEMALKYAEDYGLQEAEKRLVSSLPLNTDKLRKQFMANMGRAFAIMTRTALAAAGRGKMPSFEDRYRAVTMQDPEIIDTEKIREKLRAALASEGIFVTSRRNLNEAVDLWEKRVGNVPASSFAEEVAKINRKLMKWTRSNIFGDIDFGHPDHHRHLKDVKFDGLTLKTLSNVDYTGSSAYEGGTNDDGTPALRDLIEYNTDHPITNPGLWHFAAHEMTPGHYIDGAVADLGWRAGKLGLEASAHTMCTAETVLREGWAQNALRMAVGSESAMIDILGLEHVIQLILERLEDAGKNNASILFQDRQIPIEEVRKHLKAHCVLSDALVKKLSGAWATHPIMGPMYGPAYAVGYKVVKKGIRKHGPQKVAAAAMHQHGYLDIGTFQEVLKQGE
jgi:hypothetical protein